MFFTDIKNKWFFCHKMSRLPLPRCMHVVLDELQLRLGTWSNIVSVKQTTTLHKALLKFLGKTLSALPVLSETNVVINVLTKSDIMNLVADEGPTENILQKTVQDALKFRREVKHMSYCKSNPIDK